MKTILPYLLSFVFSFLLNLIIIPFLLKLAHKFNWYDEIDTRKIHMGKIPRIGGIGIAVSFFLPALIIPFLFSEPMGIFWSFFLGALIINLVGILDDFTNLRPLYKLTGQIAATLVVIFSGNYFTSFYIPFFNTTIESIFLGQAVTFIWIIGVTNAINLIDGMDGFSSSITAVASFGMGLAAVISGNYTQAYILLILFGSISGFFLYNLPPAKLFMGDSGSLFIGFILACMPLYAFQGNFSSFSLILGISFLLIPIYDTFSAIIRRKIRGVPFHSPDMDHLHHKLLAIGLSEKVIILITNTVTFAVSVTALLFVIFNSALFIYVQLIAWALVLILFLIISVKRQKHL